MKYGARIYKVKKTTLVKQTGLKGTPPEYVVDVDRKGDQIERHVKPSEDKAIADAVRAALAGSLTSA